MGYRSIKSWKIIGLNSIVFWYLLNWGFPFKKMVQLDTNCLPFNCLPCTVDTVGTCKNIFWKFCDKLFYISNVKISQFVLMKKCGYVSFIYIQHQWYHLQMSKRTIVEIWRKGCELVFDREMIFKNGFVLKWEKQILLLFLVD